MRGLGLLSMILLVLGVLVLAGSLVVTVAVENNEAIVDLESIFGEITPKTVKMILAELENSFLGSYMSEDMSAEIIALKIYAMTPVLYIVGGVMAGLGLIGMILSPRSSRAKARYTPPSSSGNSVDIDWF